LSKTLVIPSVLEKVFDLCYFMSNLAIV